MLMEDREEICHVRENVKKFKSVGVEKLYNGASSTKKRSSVSSGSRSNGLKRKLDSGERNVSRKKSKKEAELCSLSEDKKSKKSVHSVKLEAKAQENGGGQGGISFRLNGDVSIPKRPRDLVRRKKVELDVASKQDVSSGRASPGEGLLNCSGNGNGNGNANANGSEGSKQCGNGNGSLAQNGESEPASFVEVTAKGKKNKISDSSKVSRSSGSDLMQRVEREKSQSSEHNGDSVTRKTRKNRNKKKENVKFSLGVENKANQTSCESSRVCENSLDDEENLEENAARMLSSRFDPRCKVFSLGGNSSRVPSANGSCDNDFTATGPICRDESDIASSDNEARVLRPRDQPNRKGVSKYRRSYYEVLSRDLDSYWVLNKRVKVFWPLDKTWYFGHVTKYDSEKKLHHVKYDDREEEWIDLQNERFMLLLLPDEVPVQVGRKQVTTQGKCARKEKRLKTLDKGHNGNSYMESEPIISWLTRSTSHKSPSGGTRKKQRTLPNSAKSHLSLIREEIAEPVEKLEVSSSRKDIENIDIALLDHSSARRYDAKLPEQKLLSDSSGSPLVYFRKRLQKRDHQSADTCVEDFDQPLMELLVCGTDDYVDSVDFEEGMLLSMVNGHSSERLCPDEFIWDTDGCGPLTLIIPVTSLNCFRVHWSFPSLFVQNNLFGGQGFVLLLPRGILISVWPMVHLEILFVDNTVGLRFLLFEGSLPQGVSFVFLILAVFQCNLKENYAYEQLPVTSIRFRLTGLQGLGKQLVYAFYSFSGLASSKWAYIDRKMRCHCVFSKQLSPSECTHDNFKALRNGYRLPISNERSSAMSIQKELRRQRITLSSTPSAYAKLSGVSSDSDGTLGKIRPFARSFDAAPTLFISLHLKLLMGHGMSSPNSLEQDPLSLIDYSEKERRVDRFADSAGSSGSAGINSRVLPSCSSELLSYPSIDLGDGRQCNGVTAKPANCTYELSVSEVGLSPLNKSTAQYTETEHLTNHQLLAVDTEVECRPVAKLTVEIPSLISTERVFDSEVQGNQHPVDLALDSNDDVMCSPTPTPQSMLHTNRVADSSPSASACLSPTWPDRKQDFLYRGFCNGPKKPRTQVSYSIPPGGNDYNSKNKFHHGKGFSHRRIRRASEKKASEAFGRSRRNLELLSCDVNVLVTVGDRGWRECGARVMLEPVDHNEWRLAVKLLGDTKYSHKAHQFLQPGTTNRYTHAMMWKGGKDWTLEFTDRAQWTTFKELHEECYNRNLRAASVKNIPIPGVRLIEENDVIVAEVPFLRPSSRYYRQVETDLDIAMNPSRVLYDMDSDDEMWLMKCRGLEFNDKGCGDVSDEMFEKTMDAFEKFAIAKQRDHFSLDELEEAMAGLGPLDALIVIYEYWREKRKKKDMPLIRHLQPPLWERYQQQVRKWEQLAAKSNSAPSSECPETPLTIEKPLMFAFCLKPRGLEMSNRGSKQRSQKRLHIGALSNGVLGELESYYSPVGRRLNGCAFGDDLYFSYNHQATSDSSPLLQGTRAFSPRDMGGVGYFSLNSDGFDRNYYPKLHRNKSKKLCFVPPSYDRQVFGSFSQSMGKRSAGHALNVGSSEWHSQMLYQSDGFQRHNFEQLDPSELDEFRLRDAASAARHAGTIAKMKRENAQRMLCLADLAMHRAVSAIMTAEAAKASYDEPNDDVQMSG